MDIERTLAYLTLEEKLRMLSGDGMWHTYGVGELPRVRMSDGPNGLRMTEGGASAVPATCYPTLGMLACSWDPALCYNVGAAIGREATAMGVNLLLAPALNIKRHPLGGRNFEYFSEDPYLSGVLAKAYVAGVQSTGVGATIKHFAANNQEYKRMYSDSVIDARALHEIYLKPFRIALEAQPCAVMTAYNKLNGSYCSQNRELLSDILRKKWGYQGAVISDWGGVHDRVAALKAGLDIAMPDSLGLFEAQLKDGLQCGDITEAQIDDALRRILKLTDDVYLEPYGDYDVESHDKISYNAAAASVVLLKNTDGFLPLTKNMKVAVVGELAENAPYQGGGSAQVSALKSFAPLDAFNTRAIDVTYFRGYSATEQKKNVKLAAEAVAGTADCDAVIVYVGQPAPCEGTDRETLDLPPEQDRLIGELTASGRRVVAVVCSAGPVRMPWVNRVYSIVYAGLAGSNGALAAVDVLYGRINPCGKLAETFPVDLSDLGANFTTSDSVYRESLFVGYRYYDAIEKRVLFPFGYGLSFSDITYDKVEIRRTGDADFDVAITLSNRSVRDANEIVQVYVSDNTGRVLCAKKQLAGYRKVFVEGLTSATTVIHVGKSAFEFFDVERDRFSVPDGEFSIMVASSSTEIRSRTPVKVNGDFFRHRPAPPVYSTPLRANITDDDFAELYGSPLPAPEPPPQKGEFTLDCCINDIKSTLAGRIARRIALKRAKAVGPHNSPEYKAFVASAMFTPLSAVCAMSDGAMSLSAAKGLVEMANGKFFKGLKLILSK